MVADDATSQPPPAFEGTDAVVASSYHDIDYFADSDLMAVQTAHH
jgi:hypothetical protein